MQVGVQWGGRGQTAAGNQVTAGSSNWYHKYKGRKQVIEADFDTIAVL